MAPVEPPVEKPTSTDTPPGPATAKPSLKERFTTLLKDYGPVAMLTYLSTSVVTFATFFVALRAGVDLKALGERLGVQLEGAGGMLGTVVAAWVLLKATQIPRIFVTLVLTPAVARIPLVARLLRRFQAWMEEAKQ